MDLFEEITGIDSQDIIGGKPQLTIWKMDVDIEQDESLDNIEPTSLFRKVTDWLKSHFS